MMYCLPVDDLCHLQYDFEQRIQEDVVPQYVLFEGASKDTYLFLIDGEYVIVILDKENRNESDDQEVR